MLITKEELELRQRMEADSIALYKMMYDRVVKEIAESEITGFESVSLDFTEESHFYENCWVIYFLNNRIQINIRKSESICVRGKVVIITRTDYDYVAHSTYTFIGEGLPFEKGHCVYENGEIIFYKN